MDDSFEGARDSANIEAKCLAWIQITFRGNPPTSDIIGSLSFEQRVRIARLVTDIQPWDHGVSVENQEKIRWIVTKLMNPV